MNFRPLFKIRARIEAPYFVPNAPYGGRRIIPVSGGEFTGERISGTILNGGADCQILRHDGVAELEVRVPFQTDDGVVFMLKGHGLRHASVEVVARLEAGEEVTSSEYYFREAMFFEAPKGKYDWLNKLIAIGKGGRDGDTVLIDVYEIL